MQYNNNNNICSLYEKSVVPEDLEITHAHVASGWGQQWQVWQSLYGSNVTCDHCTIEFSLDAQKGAIIVGHQSLSHCPTLPLDFSHLPSLPCYSSLH